MLDKNDIKTIKNLLKDVPTRDDLKSFATRDDLKAELKPIKKDLQTLKKDTKVIRRDLEMVTGEFDKEQMILKKRVTDIEASLGISAS